MKRYLLLTIVFLCSFFLLQNALIISDFVGDEGRHAMQGLIIKQYIHDLAAGKAGSYHDFVQKYSEVNYEGSWYALYDPPGHAVLQGLFFLLFGASVLVARLATVFLVVLGSLFLFFFSLKFFSARDSFFVVVLFLLFPSVFEFSGLSYLDVPLSLFTVCFFYFFFFTEGFLRYAGSVFSLTLATLMKYQSMIYMAVFVVVYGLYLFFAEKPLVTEKKVVLKKSQFTRNIPPLVIILLISGVLILPWVKLSLIDGGLAGSIASEAMTKYGRAMSVSWYFFFIREAFFQTRGIFLLLFIPLFTKPSLFKGKDGHLFLPMYFYIFSTLIAASFLFSNQQLRYAIQLFPLAAILCVKGLSDLCAISKKRSWMPYVFIGMMVFLMIVDIGMMQANVNVWGAHDPELDDYFAKQAPPYLVIVPKSLGSAPVDVPYYFSSDQVLFTVQKQQKGSLDAFQVRMKEDSIIDGQDALFAYDLMEYTKKNSVFVVFFRTDAKTARGKMMIKELMGDGFLARELKHYTIIEKKNKEPQDEAFFVDMEKRVEARNEAERARILNEEGRFNEVLRGLEKANGIDPYDRAIRGSLAAFYASAGKRLAMQGQYADALKAYTSALLLVPVSKDYREDQAIAMVFVGRSLADKGDMEGAKPYFDAAIKSGALSGGDLQVVLGYEQQLQVVG